MDRNVEDMTWRRVRSCLPDELKNPIVVALNHVSKSFGGTAVMQEVSLELSAGEVVALLGENNTDKFVIHLDTSCYMNFEEVDFVQAVVTAGLSNDLTVWPNLRDKGVHFTLHTNSIIKAMAQATGNGVTSHCGGHA